MNDHTGENMHELAALSGLSVDAVDQLILTVGSSPILIEHALQMGVPPHHAPLSFFCKLSAYERSIFEHAFSHRDRQRFYNLLISVQQHQENCPDDIEPFGRP